MSTMVSVFYCLKREEGIIMNQNIKAYLLCCISLLVATATCTATYFLRKKQEGKELS